MYGSKHFKQVFLTRFFGYLAALLGTVTLIFSVEPVIAEELRYQSDKVFGVQYSLGPQVITSANSPDQFGVPGSEDQNQDSRFGSIVTGQVSNITPVSTDFGIVIEKINANAKVVANVDPTGEKEYINALSQGVAHAKGTAFPGQAGNIYLFSHSVDAPWNVVRFNAIFYLLSKLDPGDRIVLFYQGRRYDYLVFDKTVVAANETQFLTNNYQDSVLTLQTCDPPGTTLRRLIIRAKLAGG